MPRDRGGNDVVVEALPDSDRSLDTGQFEIPPACEQRQLPGRATPTVAHGFTSAVDDEGAVGLVGENAMVRRRRADRHR